MEQLLNDIAAYCRRANITASTFGTYAASDGKLVSRLSASGRDGLPRQCLPRTEEKIRDFIKANPPEGLRKKSQRRQAGGRS